MPNVALLLIPISRGSPLLGAVGVPYPAAIRFHRELGAWALVGGRCHAGARTRARLRRVPRRPAAVSSRL